MRTVTYELRVTARETVSISPSLYLAWTYCKYDLRWSSLTCTSSNTNEATELCNQPKRNGGNEWEEGRIGRGETAHIISSSLDLLVQLVLVLIPERRVTHQQDIEDHPWDTQTEHAHIVRMRVLVCFHVFLYACMRACVYTTHHRPRCPQVCHMPPSSIPQGRDILVFQQIL